MLRTSIDKIRENGFELTKKRSKRYPAKTITDADYADDLALLANTPNQAETLLHSLERAAAGIGLHVNAHKTEYMCYNQTGNITTLDGASLKLVDKFIYLGSSVSSTEKDIDTRLTKAWTAIDRLSIIWKSDLTDKMKRSFFQAAVVSILLYGCTTWTLTKRLEKKLDGNYTRMLRAILNKSWRQHPTRHQLYGHLPPITKTIQVRRTRHAGHCWRSKDELISDILLWTPTYGQAKAGRPARTYIQQLCEDTGCNPENLPDAMNNWEKWRERVRDIRAGGTTWWWWWWYIYIPPRATETVLSPWLADDEGRASHVLSHVVSWKFEHQDSLESKMTLWKDKVTLQKVGVTSWKDRTLTNMNSTTKEKCPQGVCSGEGEYITHDTCSHGNDLDMYPATTCDCGRKFNSLRGLRIHKACWCKQRNSPTGECKLNDGLMN